ncbi:PIG-L deacetylase family protein [Patescibacteria group bacterium]
MKWLFIYAHPDDESVAAGGTILKLVDLGHEIKIVLATAGEAGKVNENAKEELSRAGSVRELRIKEAKKAAKILGVEDIEVLEFVDGQINNEVVWGELTLSMIDEIEKYKPNVVVTFDHSGWYFHLDHVGVSLSVMRAVQRCMCVVDVLLFNPFHPPGIKSKWSYDYPDEIRADFQVDIESVLEAKIQALEAHASQGISLVEKLKKGKMSTEYFQLVHATKNGKKMMKKLNFFETISS